MTVAELAGLLRMSQSTIRRRIRDGSIPVVRTGRLIRISDATVTEITTPKEAAQ